jgi:hypothetical protein
LFSGVFSRLTLEKLRRNRCAVSQNGPQRISAACNYAYAAKLSPLPDQRSAFAAINNREQRLGFNGGRWSFVPEMEDGNSFGIVELVFWIRFVRSPLTEAYRQQYGLPSLTLAGFELKGHASHKGGK